MAIKESRDIVIEASPEEILDVIADFEAMPEWSGPHQSAEILETGDDGRPSKVEDEGQDGGHHRRTGGGLYVERQRGELDAGQLRPAEVAGRQVHSWFPRVTETLVKMEISVDPNVPLPGFVLKRAVKGTMDSATKELRNRVLKVKKGK